jgi:phosphoglycerate kinase
LWPGEVVLCENVRLQLGEKANDIQLAKKMANLGDIFVMDAFATAHRAHASTCGIAEYAALACAGPLLIAELKALSHALDAPHKPVVAIVGGAKVSSKLEILRKLVTQVDYLILGGGIANTFLTAADHFIGKSLFEADLVTAAQDIMQAAKGHGCNIPLPTDVVVAKEITANAVAQSKKITSVAFDDIILDIAQDTCCTYSNIIQQAETIIWNGPVGVFEYPAFSLGTQAITHSIADSKAYSIAGGGDTIAAIEKFQVANKISYISTGGGAFLELLAGKKLPAVAILEKHAVRAKKANP